MSVNFPADGGEDNDSHICLYFYKANNNDFKSNNSILMPITGFVWRVDASGGGLFDINSFSYYFGI